MATGTELELIKLIKSVIGQGDLNVPLIATDASGNVSLVGPDGEDAGFVQANSTGYQYATCILPLNQSGGPSVLPTDYSKEQTACTFGASVTAPWANAGYFTSVAGADDKTLIVPNSAIRLNLSTDSFLFGFTLKKSAPAGTETILGCSNLTNEPGFSVNIQLTSGYLGQRLFVNGGVVATTYSSVAAATDAEKRIMVAWDAVDKTFTSWIDGAQVLRQTATTVAATDIIATNLRLGRTTTGNTVDAKFAGFHFARFLSSGLPKNMDELALADNTFRRSALSSLPVFL